MVMNRKQARRRLDAQFQRISSVGDVARPHRGWIRAIRDALGMSSAELAHRMGISQSTVAKFEDSERQGTIKLETLRRTADALNCELVYFLLPRTTLDTEVRSQAHKKATQHLRGISHHSRLEDQAVTEEDAEDQVDELTMQLMDRHGLWSEAESRH